ncbi:MAG: SDR family NAD(P)-dependent oxidoreductase, partial [Verrucomicrobiaceae bacterium]
MAELGGKFGKDNVFGTTIDITNRTSVRAAIDATILRYGGLDVLINIAAVFFPPDTSGRLDDERWKRTYDINLVGSYIVADEAAATMRAQGLGGSLVLVSSANAVVSK